MIFDEAEKLILKVADLRDAVAGLKSLDFDMKMTGFPVETSEQDTDELEQELEKESQALACLFNRHHITGPVYVLGSDTYIKMNWVPDKGISIQGNVASRKINLII